MLIFWYIWTIVCYYLPIGVFVRLFALIGGGGRFSVTPFSIGRFCLVLRQKLVRKPRTCLLCAHRIWNSRYLWRNRFREYATTNVLVRLLPMGNPTWGRRKQGHTLLMEPVDSCHSQVDLILTHADFSSVRFRLIVTRDTLIERSLWQWRNE